MGCPPPFSRRPRRERDDEPDEWAVSGVYDFIAREYGWGRDYVDAVLTDEQLIAYLDAASDRLAERQHAQFDGWVEAVRVGSIFASGKEGQRQYGRWKARNRNTRPGRRGLTGEALERAVMGIAAMFPGQVIREAAG